MRSRTVPHHRSPMRSTSSRRTYAGSAIAIAGVLTLFFTMQTSNAADAVGLGTADSYAVLGGSAVTNTGDSVLWGDLGVSPGSSVTGFPPGIVHGEIYANNAQAEQAQSDLTTAYNNAAGQEADAGIPDPLGGNTLLSGVYSTGSSTQLTGALTLDAQGDPNAVFIFQIGTTLTTASNSSVVLTNGAQPCNVFWQVGSSATIGTGTQFIGTIMANASITMNNGATIDGRALARTGAVTLDNNVFDHGVCDTSGPTPSPSPTATTTPSPTSSPGPSTPPNGDDSGDNGSGGSGSGGGGSGSDGSGSSGSGNNGSVSSGGSGDGSRLGTSANDTLPGTGASSIGQGPLMAIAMVAIVSGLALIASNTRRVRRLRS